MEVYVLLEVYETGHGGNESTIWDVFKDQEKALECKQELIKKYPDSDFDVIPTKLVE